MKFLTRNPFLLFAVFTFVAYLPVLLPFYHVKNDFVTQIFPTRFFIGESLYSNTFPWWNPYINYGIPQYGDMNAGFWNPVLWLIAKGFGYTIFTATLEEIFYILIGGWGIYRLAQLLVIRKEVAIICAISYISGGYIIGHLQHFCWITGAAFFPYVLLYYLRSIKTPILKHFILGGIFGFAFVSSTHPGLIIGALYFFLFVFIYLLLQNKTYLTNLKKPGVLKVSLLYGFFILLFSPIVWVSNLEVLQHLTRASSVSLSETLMEPTTLASYISLIFPLSVHKGTFFETDISMRNISIGLPLLIGVYFFLKSKKIREFWPVIFVITFFILLAAGGAFKIFAHTFFPLIGFVRLNGEFAYFVFFILIFIGGIGLSTYSEASARDLKKERIFLIIQISLIVCALATLTFIGIRKNSLLFHLSSETVWDIKAAINQVTIWDLTLISIVFQLALILFLRNKIASAAILPISIYLVLLTWFCLPFTGLGKLPRSEVQSIINTYPKGIIKPNQKSINENSYIENKYDPIIGSSAFYSKQIGHPNPPSYPILLNSTQGFYKNKSLTNFIKDRSFLFLSTDTTVNAITSYDSSLIKVDVFTPTLIRTRVTNNGFRYFILLQNNYPQWETYINGIRVQHFTAFGTFIGVPLTKGAHKIEFRFVAGRLQIVLLANICILVLALILLFLQRSKNIYLAGPRSNEGA